MRLHLLAITVLGAIAVEPQAGAEVRQDNSAVVARVRQHLILAESVCETDDEASNVCRSCAPTPELVEDLSLAIVSAVLIVETERLNISCTPDEVRAFTQTYCDERFGEIPKRVAGALKIQLDYLIATPREERASHNRLDFLRDSLVHGGVVPPDPELSDAELLSTLDNVHRLYPTLEAKRVALQHLDTNSPATVLCSQDALRILRARKLLERIYGEDSLRISAPDVESATERERRLLYPASKEEVELRLKTEREAALLSSYVLTMVKNGNIEIACDELREAYLEYVEAFAESQDPNAKPAP